MSRRTVLWLIPILLTVHNAEEAVAFRHYWPDLPALMPRPLRSVASGFPYTAMLAVLIALVVAAFILALIVDKRAENRVALWLLLAFEATVGLNALWHLGVAVIAFHGYAPGVITAVILNAPFAVYCFTRATREHWLSRTALWYTALAAVVLHGPVFIGGLWAASIAGTQHL